MTNLEFGLMMSVIVVLSWYDATFRRCPNWLSLPLLGMGIGWYGAESLWPSVIVFGIMTLAQFPPGDIKGATAMAAWAPLTVMIFSLVIVLAVTYVIMETRWYNLYQWAHRWPWLAGLGFALTLGIACRILLIG